MNVLSRIILAVVALSGPCLLLTYDCDTEYVTVVVEDCAGHVIYSEIRDLTPQEPCITQSQFCPPLAMQPCRVTMSGWRFNGIGMKKTCRDATLNAGCP